jgi:hypothetical protein
MELVVHLEVDVMLVARYRVKSFRDAAAQPSTVLLAIDSACAGSGTSARRHGHRDSTSLVPH